MKIVDVLQLYIEKPKENEDLFDIIKDNVKIWIKSTIRTLRNYLKYGRDIAVSPFDLAVEEVEEKLAVSARKDTYAFDITYRSSDPKQAAAVANMAADIFLEERSAAYRSEAARAREFIEMQLEESRKALEHARAAVLAYRNSGETFNVTSEYKEKLKNVSDLEDTLAKAEGKLAGLKSTPLTPKSNADLVEQKATIDELKEQILSLRRQLAAYPKKETQLNALTLDERLAEQSYEFFLKQYEEARVRESAQVTEIRIASRAVPGTYPIKPLKYMYAGLSFATALIMAIGCVLFFESLDPRVRTARELDDEVRGASAERDSHAEASLMEGKQAKA
jgi:uncharacterized protein involved in exopolysaccharide biosynthesis